MTLRRRGSIELRSAEQPGMTQGLITQLDKQL